MFLWPLTIISVLVLLDVSAVFDNVDHNILSQQFESTIGITSTRLQCFKSYLSTRLEFDHENVESYSHRVIIEFHMVLWYDEFFLYSTILLGISYTISAMKIITSSIYQ